MLFMLKGFNQSEQLYKSKNFKEGMADAQPPRRARKRYSIVVSKASQVSLKDQLGLSNESKEDELGANHFALFTPAFKDILSDVENGLKSNFKSVQVKILDKCPNLNEVFQPQLQQSPNKDKDNKNEQQQIYHELLRANGICGGTPVIVDVGGLPYLYTKKYHKKSYDLKDILEILNKKLKIKEETVAFIFGSAYSDNAISSTGGEVIVNYKNNLNHHNKLCEIGPKDIKEISDANANINKESGPATPVPEFDEPKEEEKKLESPFDVKIGGVSCKKYESADQFGCKANLFICQGDNEGEVLYIKVKTRTGKENLIQCLRNALKKVKGVGDQDSQIGVGGIVKVCIFFFTYFLCVYYLMRLCVLMLLYFIINFIGYREGKSIYITKMG